MAMHKGFTHGAASASIQEQTLGDYIERITKDDTVLKKKKLTFDEWWNTHWYNCTAASTETGKLIWNAAQENKE